VNVKYFAFIFYPLNFVVFFMSPILVCSDSFMASAVLKLK